MIFPPLGNSSVSRTDWKKIWFIEPDGFVGNLVAWRAFAEIKAAFSVVPAGFVRSLVILLMGGFAQSAFPLVPAARNALMYGIPDSAALILVAGALLAALEAYRLLDVFASINRETGRCSILVPRILKNISRSALGLVQAIYEII